MFSTQNKQNLNPMRTWQRRITRQVSNAVTTAQDFTFDLPRDHFIHEIHITVYQTTSPFATRLAKDLIDGLNFVQLVGNGNKVLKYGTADMFKQVMMLNKRNPQTGLYTLFFSDPKIPDAKPLPSWVFTSLQLILSANAASIFANKVLIEIVVTESAYENQDLSSWRVLIEKYLKWQKWGTNIGEQDYEHERAYKVYGYLYCMDDNNTLSPTIYDLIRLLGRKPEGEVTIIDVPVALQRAECDSEIAFNHLTDGYISVEWLKGFPANEFASLYSKPNIPVAGTNAGLRVLERYVL